MNWLQKSFVWGRNFCFVDRLFFIVWCTIICWKEFSSDVHFDHNQSIFLWSRWILYRCFLLFNDSTNTNVEHFQMRKWHLTFDWNDQQNISQFDDWEELKWRRIWSFQWKSPKNIEEKTSLQWRDHLHLDSDQNNPIEIDGFTIRSSMSKDKFSVMSSEKNSARSEREMTTSDDHPVKFFQIEENCLTPHSHSKWLQWKILVNQNLFF